MVALRPELRAAAAQRDAIGLADRVEDLIDKDMMTPQDRQAAYEAVAEWPDDKSPEYAYARASLAGRLAEIRGLSAVNLLAELERYARRSMVLDPKWRDGAARRMLGTLYVLAPASVLQHGDSEEGLSLLQEQVEAHPDNPTNHLRLAEGFLALSDPEPAHELLCHVMEHEAELRPSEKRLAKTLVDSLGGKSELLCE